MSVVDWLLEGDPAIRWQVMRDLTDGPDTAAIEVPLFFSDEEILSYERAIDGWINE